MGLRVQPKAAQPVVAPKVEKTVAKSNVARTVAKAAVVLATAGAAYAAYQYLNAPVPVAVVVEPSLWEQAQEVAKAGWNYAKENPAVSATAGGLGTLATVYGLVKRCFRQVAPLGAPLVIAPNFQWR